jgi:putative holliday junction resolvase
MSNYSRLLALDIGDKRIGVAVSDPTRTLAKPVETIHRKNTRLDLARVANLVEQHEAAAIIVGLPKNMDGTEGEQASKVRAFAEKLSGEMGLTVHFEDERLSTFTAIERLVERGIKTGENRDLVDMEAAAVILESFLDRKPK